MKIVNGVAPWGERSRSQPRVRGFRACRRVKLSKKQRSLASISDARLSAFQVGDKQIVSDAGMYRQGSASTSSCQPSEQQIHCFGNGCCLPV